MTPQQLAGCESYGPLEIYDSAHSESLPHGADASSKCSCGRPLVTGIPGVNTCLGDFIGNELRRVERELRQMDGYVPWWQTQEFKDSMAGGGR